MRSLLFVPADSQRKLEKSLTGDVDVLIFDLEDAVAIHNKADARACLAHFLKQHRDATSKLIYVRVNDVSTGLTIDDIVAAAPFMPDGWVLPKSRNADDVNQLAHYLDLIERIHYLGNDKLPARIIAIATETARSIFGAGDYAKASSRLVGLMWGAENLSADIGASATQTDSDWTAPFALARSLCLLGAANAGVIAIDTVPTELRNEEALTLEAGKAKRDGFSAKAAIHPAQVDVIDRCLSISDTERAWAMAVVAAFAQGAGVGVLNGRMLDRPHLRLAQRMLGSPETPGEHNPPK